MISKRSNRVLSKMLIDVDYQYDEVIKKHGKETNNS